MNNTKKDHAVLPTSGGVVKPKSGKILKPQPKCHGKPRKENFSETTKSTASKTELVQTDDAAQKTAPNKSSPISKTNAKAVTVKPFPKKVGRKPLNKNLGVNLKTTEKKPAKIKQKIAKALLNNAKTNLENKKSLLKNGIKPKRPYKRKIKLHLGKVGRPRLIDVYSLEANVEKKPVKKRMKKMLDTKKPKVHTTNYSSIDDTINSILNQIMVEEDEKIKPKMKKLKMEPTNESIEDVINDLTYLIKNEDIKQENVEPKTEVVKTKKVTRKPKVDLLKKKTVKKEALENITIDASAKHLIDMLDLSVSKTEQLSLPVCNRRHSIEKFSIDANSADIFNVFHNLPRTPTPRSKRSSRGRQSVDSTASLKKNSPYSTRSDAPQLLRNGKHRKMKNSLLDGLECKKRKRLCSDFSGSEKSVSKLSGYESDSSFTDTTSFPCSDSLDQKDEQSKIEIKKEIPLSQSEIDVISVDSKINDSCLCTTDLTSVVSLNGFIGDPVKNENIMDNNSNVCDEVVSEVPIIPDAIQVPNLYDEDIQEPDINDQGIKVPEKSIILDKMKQTFNDVSSEDQEKRTTRASLKKTTVSEDELHVSPSIFYGSSRDSTENKDEIECDNSVEQNTSPSNDLKEELNVEMCTLPESDNINTSEVDSDRNISDEKLAAQVEETAENLAIKRDILQALGLQSLKAAEEAKLKEKNIKNDYTGTLKTVIKLNRFEKKKGRTSLKMTLQKKNKLKENDIDINMIEDENGQRTLKEIASSSWRSHGPQSSDTAGALRKSHYFNRSNNMDGSSEHTSDGDGTAADGEDSGKALVIPEKASSFSIHPGRLCKDECSYCFGKFGLFDTPCHIAQIKSVDRQNKILQNEKHLTRDSCLCDACYRHVDRKSNTPSYLNKGSKRNNIIAPGPRQNHCHVLGCGRIATNILRRKWLIKMRKSVREVINIDLENPGLHSIPICTEHYTAVEHLMVCAVCKRKLARNHIHYLGPEMNELNTALNEEGIPVKLIDKPVVCKLCRYFSSLVMKPIEERPENTSEFFKEYKTRLLNIYDVDMTEELAEDNELLKQSVDKEATRRKKRKNLINGEPRSGKHEIDTSIKSQLSTNTKRSSKSRSESPSDYMVDYNTLIPSIAMDCGSDVENLKYETTITPIMKPSKSESAPQEMSDSSKSKNKNTCCNKTSAIAVQRLGSNPCISVRQLFPGEEDVGLQGHIEFGNVKEKTPEGWEKCSSTIQYDNDTKLLWQELQKPYGNQSSFLRHLILLEKYFRSGDLILSPNASHHSINYSESVQNRLRAYDNIPLNNSVKKSNSGIVTTKLLTPSVSIINAANIPKNTPITISQISSMSPNSNKTRNPGVPPGLISLHPGTSRPVASTVIKVPQPQKIKIPLTKNWKPNLIPIDSSKGDKEKKPGHVKVMSGGKPYHITMDDYNRMCAIKKSYDLKQKRLLEAQNNSCNQGNYLKPLLPRKGLVISKSSTITSPKSDHSITDATEVENSLEKLDKTVENLESKLSESAAMLLPKIPKSLTVIPQTVSHRPPEKSNANLVISKPKSASSKS
ncbi:hypothetical protein RN001_003384 [Aquatica leii]|uniref:Uncharacterized protein n=1 Tax=Aquatica leii TaxID=1421715 RepID=A0AAN7SRK5_9COLE|nr:hypothetical protein RN001_003384 [Aquatica leii]